MALAKAFIVGGVMQFLTAEKRELTIFFSFPLLGLRSGGFHGFHRLLLGFLELLDASNVVSAIDEVEVGLGHRRVQDDRGTDFSKSSGTLYVFSVGDLTSALMARWASAAKLPMSRPSTLASTTMRRWVSSRLTWEGPSSIRMSAT